MDEYRVYHGMREETAMPRTESPAMLEPVDRAEEGPVASGLVEGIRLDQPTFHALYEATPPGFRAELIDGVVHMPSPVGRSHGRSHRSVIVWLSYYEENTPGLESLDNATTILGWRSELQPDALLRILPEYGGHSRNDGNYVGGAPELVFEVARSTRYLDLGPKRNEYDRAGVLEYVVLAARPDDVLWFGRDGDSLVKKPIGEDGLYRSAIFPGLWLDPAALIRGDTKRLRAVLDLGLATPEHAAFVAKLAAAKG
jgi:hypothetical protein